MNLTLLPTESTEIATVLPQPKRFTLAEYAQLTELGFFDGKPRMELVRGELIEMVSKNVAHVLCCRQLNRQLTRLLDDAIVQCQDPIIILPGSEPEPDFAILIPTVEGKATGDQVLMVIEVADSSLNYDRAVKGPLYAEAGIPHYWIFNLLDRQVECFSQPQQNAGKWGYGLQQVVLPSGTIALPDAMQGAIDLSVCFSTV
ncbi:MAG: hypothetical protein RLZZ511_2437 [Cyanobacteriota bacterium]|jgi:Uma2 family endonuclease